MTTAEPIARVIADAVNAQAGPTPPKSPRRWRRLLLALVLVLGVIGTVVALVLAVDAIEATSHAGPSQPARSFTLIGTLTLHDRVVRTPDGGCAGGDGFGDIHTGSSVTVYDASGTIIVATGRINKATAADITQIGAYDRVGLCELAFSAPEVPGGHGFYAVEISHRGKVAFDEAEAQAGRIGLTLGR